MEWQNPEALYLILPLCIGWLMLALYSDRRRHAAQQSFAADTMWSRIFPTESRRRFVFKLILREVAIALGLVALAGPRFGEQYEQVVPRGSDLYVLIDVSRSMLADDVPPSRLGRAKVDIASLVNRLEGERIGLIAFAGQAVVKCPLTIDYDSFRRSLEELDTDSAPRGGTAIGDAIRKALEVFQAKSDRDQAILLITDGDDQQSYPLEAASVAAERHVTIFTVGLGDALRGARIPQKSNTQTFTEYQGEQVWSKMDGSLLQQIALKTSGVYVPAGTRAYDLSELYVNYLQGRRGSDATGEKRIRRSERFQIFLAISLICLLIDLCISPYQRQSPPTSFEDEEPVTTDRGRPATKPVLAKLITFLLLSGLAESAFATDPAAQVREGLRLYSQDKFDEAKDKFTTALEEFDKRKLSPEAAISAFDEACALHRKGDFEKARESYLRAGLSQAPSIATSAHFNLGNMCADQARRVCGDKPESVPVEKRKEVLEQLSHAITAYRHCLELKSDHAAARRNLELIRQWIKYYTDKWNEQDREKRRDESNLIEFLEFMIQTQTGLRKTTEQLPDQSSSNELAEVRRLQEELREEIPTLRDKITDAFRPQAQPNSQADPNETKELEENIATLRDWADKAGRKMAAASAHLQSRETVDATKAQQTAIDELERIWETVVPFQPLLNKLVQEQKSITNKLKPESNPSKNERDHDEDEPKQDQSDQKRKPDADQNASPQLSDDDFQQLENDQAKVLKRSRMLAPKAQAELEQLENSTASPAEKSSEDKDKDQPGADAADPKQLKEALEKALELSPQAVEKMESAVEDLRQKDRANASSHADEAQKILEEMQKSQPKNNQNKNQQNQDQKQNQDQQQDQKQDQNPSSEKQDSKKQDQKKQDQDQQDKSQKQEDEKRDQQAGKNEKSPDQKSQGQVSKDQIEEAIRKVRERQQEKRERDRKLKALHLGKSPVEKDW